MDYIEDDFTDALIDAICEKSDNKKDIEDAFNESKDDFDLLYVVLNDESYAACSKGSKLIWK